MKSRDKSISLKAGTRLEITKCPGDRTLNKACEGKLAGNQKFRVVHPVADYVGKPPELVVTELTAEHESKKSLGKLFNFTATIAANSDVQSAEEDVIEIEGYCNPTIQTGMAWLKTK